MPPKKKSDPVAENATIHELAKQVNSFFAKEGGAKRDVLIPASSIQLKFISSGSRSLDLALGGGIAIGRSVEFVGELSTCKSYFAQKILANAQQAGMRAYLYDTEGSFEPQRSKFLGVDTSALQLVDSSLRGDEGMDVIEQLLLAGNACVVVDSVAALLPKQEAEKRMGEETVGRQAHLMSKAMRKLTNANHQDSILIFINQLRENIGITFGPTTKPPGGKALGFYATHRIKFARIESKKEMRTRYIDGKAVEKNMTVKHVIQAAVEKNKISAPHREAIFLFDLETGEVDQVEEIFNLGLELGLIKNDGQMYTFPNELGENESFRFKGSARAGVELHRDHLGMLLDSIMWR